MRRHRTSGVILAVGWLALAGSWSSPGQVASPSSQKPGARIASNLELTLLRSLQANPLTAPYTFATEARGKQIALRGRVGTKQVHDVAIQTAIALGVPVIDDLVIDTAAAHQAASYPAPSGYGPAMSPRGYGPGGYVSGFPGAGSPFGPLPYTYPPPILGRLDDPFFGFEPPAISYPPFWGALSYARQGGLPDYPAQPGMAANTSPPMADSSRPVGAPAANSGSNDIPFGTIDMEIDPRGIATLRGTVPSFAERIALGQKVVQTPGVSQVVNLVNVQEVTAIPTDKAPPPPFPAPPAPAQAVIPPTQTEGASIPPDTDPVGQRAARSLTNRPALAGSPVRVKVRDGVASVSGKVPTVYEAMLAYRAVQQTPGVREVEDRLEFMVPDGSNVNPLLEKGRPEDVEPYLEAQLRRQVGDIAHVDRVRVQGNSLDIRGTLGREEDRGRFDAIVRSMPILRGYRLNAEVPVEAR